MTFILQRGKKDSTSSTEFRARGVPVQRVTVLTGALEPGASGVTWGTCLAWIINSEHEKHTCTFRRRVHRRLSSRSDPSVLFCPFPRSDIVPRSSCGDDVSTAPHASSQSKRTTRGKLHSAVKLHGSVFSATTAVQSLWRIRWADCSETFGPLENNAITTM